MAKLSKHSNAAEVTYPGTELLDKTVRSICRKLVREQGWRYSWHRGAGYPQLITPDGRRTYVPKTPGTHNNAFEYRIRRLGAVLDNKTAPRRSSYVGESLFSHPTEADFTDGEWRERQREEGGWRAKLLGQPEPEPEPEPVPQVPAYTQDLLRRLSREHTVRPDARGNGRWTLAQARQMFKDGYSLDVVINRTGWGRMWFDDLAERLASG